jgi:hypothetical protein
MLRHWVSDDSGFTLVEAMVAAFVLLIGLAATLTMVDQANQTTSSTKAREQGVSLQRELIESARSIPYDQLAPTSIASRVMSLPNLGDSSGSQPGWTITRRGVTYTATIGVCSVDDPADGAGPQDSAMFCVPGAATGAQCSNWLGITGSVQGTAGAVSAASNAGLGVGKCGIDLNLDGTVDQLVQADVAANVCITLPLLFTCPGVADSNPDDYKRIVTLVRWDRGNGSRYALQSTTVPNPGVSAAPAVTGVSTTAGFPNPSSPARFTAATNRVPSAVTWYVDGTAQSTSGNSGGSGTSWWFDWALGSVDTTIGAEPGSNEMLDGNYVISAKAFDGYGQYGSARAKTVTLNRRQPYEPTGFAGGRNGAVVEFEWAPSAERDLQGYRVYRSPAEGGNEVCALTLKTSCQDTNPPASSSLHYYLVAVDKTDAGVLRDGDKSGTITVTESNDPPFPPTNLSLSTSNGDTTLTWSASPGDPNFLLQGDKVDYYRIYRDGTAVANRYDRTGDGTVLSWTDTATDGATHTYWVVAVDTQLAESTKLGPVAG